MPPLCTHGYNTPYTLTVSQSPLDGGMEAGQVSCQQVVMLLGGFGRCPRHVDLDSARLGRREGAGDVLERSALGLRYEEDDEDEEENEQHDEHEERVRPQRFLRDTSPSTSTSRSARLTSARIAYYCVLYACLGL